MKIEKPKLIIVDIDGTIRMKGQKISNRTVNIINKIISNGIMFAVASGRTVFEIKEMLKDYDLKPLSLYIGENGYETYDSIKSTTYYENPLKKEWVKKIIDEMLIYDTNISAYIDNKIIFTRKDWIMELSIANTKLKNELVDDLSIFYKNDLGKLMFRDNEEKIDRIIEQLKKKHFSNYYFYKSCPVIIEVSNIKVNKAAGLKRFCNENNISLDQVLAFGDTTNDNEMLEVSGCGVCLKNGTEDTKKVADYITDLTCEEEGFCDFIENCSFFKELG